MINSTVVDQQRNQLELDVNSGLGMIELLINLVGIPASALNFILLLRTQLIHPNMKYILLYQSVCLFMRGFGRFVICLTKFTFDPLISERLEPQRTLFLLGVSNRNFLGHVLIIERVMATVWVASYERKRNCRFFALWSPIVFFTALFNVIMLGNSSSSLPNIFINSPLLILGLLEFVIFVLIWDMNKRFYVGSTLKRGEHSLSEKYQLSENIRIGKQLMPTLVCHFLSLSMNVLKLFWSYFGASGYVFLLPITTTLGSMLGLLIEITIISCHPFLKRDFYCLLMQICAMFGMQKFVRNSIFDESLHFDVAHNRRRTIAVKDIITGNLTEIDQSSEKHFALLQQAWESARPQTQESRSFQTIC